MINQLLIGFLIVCSAFRSRRVVFKDLAVALVEHQRWHGNRSITDLDARHSRSLLGSREMNADMIQRGLCHGIIRASRLIKECPESSDLNRTSDASQEVADQYWFISDR